MEPSVKVEARELPPFPELTPICDLIRLPKVLQLSVRRPDEEPFYIQVRQCEGTRWQVLASGVVDVEGQPVDGANFLAPPGPTPPLQLGEPWPG